MSYYNSNSNSNSNSQDQYKYIDISNEIPNNNSIKNIFYKFLSCFQCIKF